MTHQELNEAVARKLGWEAIHQVKVEGFRDELVGMRGDPWPSTVPDYAGSIAAAWEIVEWVAKNCDLGSNRHPYGIRLEHHTENWKETWYCEFPEITEAPPYEEMNDDASATANTAPLAICLAFLKLLD